MGIEQLLRQTAEVVLPQFQNEAMYQCMHLAPSISLSASEMVEPPYKSKRVFSLLSSQ